MGVLVLVCFICVLDGGCIYVCMCGVYRYVYLYHGMCAYMVYVCSVLGVCIMTSNISIVCLSEGK